jgi:hypothetical protein
MECRIFGGQKKDLRPICIFKGQNECSQPPKAGEKVMKEKKVTGRQGSRDRSLEVEKSYHPDLEGGLAHS